MVHKLFSQVSGLPGSRSSRNFVQDSTVCACRACHVCRAWSVVSAGFHPGPARGTTFDRHRFGPGRGALALALALCALYSHYSF